MAGVASTGATANQLQIVADVHAGSVILMGNTSAGVAGVRKVTDQLRAADPETPVTLLVATDQEGGLVRRLRGAGFSDMPTAATQATWSDATLRSRAKTWAAEMVKAGVNSPLGPVADVVPPEIGRRNEAIGANNRGYGATADQVSSKVTAVVKGFRDGGVATSVKHFPGIGRVIGNTDFGTNIRDTTTTRTDPLLAGFEAGIEAGTDMVMVGTVIYTRIDAKNPAAFSRTVITDMLRGDLGWQGVVISDDLGVAQQVSFLSPGARAVAFLRAGGDIIINVDPATVRTMAKAIAAEAAKDADFAAELTVKADRVLQLKKKHGLKVC